MEKFWPFLDDISVFGLKKKSVRFPNITSPDIPGE